ncbi:MAG TPA: hypothetical protein VK517_00965 [Cyclobacteriaceae bacterium]|nr:hypothetical protein [Cyclobacteriaceae bacterium]
MKNNSLPVFLMVLLGIVTSCTLAEAQRFGGLPHNAILNRLLISNGPKGPIQGGESAVTDMILLKDGWVYGSTKATWGAEHCHLFRTDGEKVEHVLNLTSRFPGQTAITDISPGKGNVLIGCTSADDAVFDGKSKSYDGGHLFSFDPATKKMDDLGIVARGQGINCIAIDSVRGKIYGVTYPAGHLFSFDLKTKAIKDFGEVMTPWRVKDLGRVSWRGVPKVLMIDDAGTVYFSTYYRTEIEMAKQELMKGGSSTYSSLEGGRIYRLGYGEEKPVFTGAVIPTQTGMDSDPIYENGIASAIRARDGGFWCGTINDGFLFKFEPSTSTVINKGKAFQYWNLKSLAYGDDGKLYMLGGRDEDNSWIMSYDPMIGSLACLGWPENTAQCSVICADKKGRIIIAENLRHSFMWVFEPSGMVIGDR